MSATHASVTDRVLFSGCKIRRENLWLVYLQPPTNHRLSLPSLQPVKRTLVTELQACGPSRGAIGSYSQGAATTNACNELRTERPAVDPRACWCWQGARKNPRAGDPHPLVHLPGQAKLLSRHCSTTHRISGVDVPGMHGGTAQGGSRLPAAA
jgi:hypothetical protein